MGNSAGRLGLIAVLMAVTAAGAANGQSIRDDIKNAIDRKYEILQQQADTERMRAETERKRVEADRERVEAETNRLQSETSRSTGYAGRDNTFAVAGRYIIQTDSNSLAAVYPSTYRLVNGVILQFTGGFSPDAPTVCIAYCPSSR